MNHTRKKLHYKVAVTLLALGSLFGCTGDKISENKATASTQPATEPIRSQFKTMAQNQDPPTFACGTGFCLSETQKCCRVGGYAPFCVQKGNSCTGN